ncbi:MAG: DUF4339 domain-containing protein [Deltaproteobacteria bacterium]|nr:DUF4339 domain-containing protein [Deltaproteobacteria bacterium]
MEQGWYLHADGKTVGPLDEDEIVQRIASRTLGREAMVCAVGTSEWRRIRRVPLFGAAFEAAAGKGANEDHRPSSHPPEPEPPPPPPAPRSLPPPIPRDARKPKPAPGSAPPPVVPAAPTYEWYFEAGGRVVGPYEHRRVVEGLRTGGIAPDDRAWRAGMAHWAQVVEIAELAAELPASPAAVSPPTYPRTRAGTSGSPPQPPPTMRPPAALVAPAPAVAPSVAPPAAAATSLHPLGPTGLVLGALALVRTGRAGSYAFFANVLGSGRDGGVSVRLCNGQRVEVQEADIFRPEIPHGARASALRAGEEGWWRVTVSAIDGRRAHVRYENSKQAWVDLADVRVRV